MLTTALDNLLGRIGDPLDATKPRPMVTLEEFFTDNDDRDSIGPNARKRFGPRELYAALLELRSGEGFHDIRVEIMPELSSLGWPRSDTIWIVSNYSRGKLPQKITPNFWTGFLPVDWLSYPRHDSVATERLTIPGGAFAFGFDYS